MKILFGLNDSDLLELCMKSPFPGTRNWPYNHPIWDCYVKKHISPKEAWNKKEYLTKAINNLYYICEKSIQEDKYPDFINKIINDILYLFDDHNPIPILQEVVNRFTVAKIAPKVTALQDNVFIKLIQENNIDLSNGVYCPMAGFGGIVRGSSRFTDNIEAYDINPNFCRWYGWKERDVLAQKVTTDKVVVACPPFGKNTERWDGTPDNMYYDFEEWCKLIKEYVIAPNYIFFGPEIRQNNNKCGLFSKKYGIQYYPEYSNQ